MNEQSHKKKGGNGGHHHHHHHTHSADENILVAFFLHLFFVFVEIVGAFFTNSFAILSDAVHDFGDCIAIGFAYVMERFSNKAPDEKYTYGYRRYSLVSAVVTSLILVVGSVFVIVGSVGRIAQPKEVHGLGMVIIAVFGVVINGAAVIKTRSGTGVNEKAISLHLLEDVLGWLAVLLGSALIFFFKWYFIDGVLSVLIAVVLIVESSKTIKDIFAVFLEKTPEGIDVKSLIKELEEIKGVENTHHIHVWSLDGEKNMATMHLKTKNCSELEEYEKIKLQAEGISKKHGIHHLTVQIDFCGEACNDECEL